MFKSEAVRIVSTLTCVVLIVCASALPVEAQRRPAKPAARVLFDDFSYSSRAQLAGHGWIVRTAEGWPGVPGAGWWGAGVTFVKDEAAPRRNVVLRMTSKTGGPGSKTNQTQVCHQRK